MFDPFIVYSQLVDRTLADCWKALLSLLQVQQGRARTCNLCPRLVAGGFAQSQSRCQCEV